MTDFALIDPKDIEGFYLDGSFVLDNFAPFQIEWQNKLWPTAEHAYQAAHFLRDYPELAEQVRLCRSPREASDFANANASKDRPDWADVKLQFMSEICTQKLKQHKYIQSFLLQTGKKHIVEMSPTDAFWGWGPHKDGRNELGAIWMRLRDLLRTGQLR